MTTLLPKDADNNIIPAMRLLDGGAHSLSVGAASTRNSVAFDNETKIISLYATADMFVKFGDNTVNATTSDHFFPAGIYYDVAIAGGSGKGPHNAYIAAIRAAEDGTLYISEKE
jgi:hypothetical protein